MTTGVGAGDLRQGRIKTSCVIVASPRTGTNLLCDLLASTRVAGSPAEYLSGYTKAEMSRRWGTTNARDYLRRVLDTATPNGVIGVKVMWEDLPNILADLRDATGAEAAASDLAVIAAAFPNPHFVSLSRENTVAQAVSWAKAELTGAWRYDTPVPPTVPRFELQRVRSRVRLAEHYKDVAADWMGRVGIKPLEITYEQLVADMYGITRTVLEFLGLDPDVPISTSIRPQADRLNQEWIARYEAAQPLPGQRPSLGRSFPRDLLLSVARASSPRRVGGRS